MVEFCEKCGALLFPEKKKSKTVLKCRSCGAIQDPNKSSGGGYRVINEIQHTPQDETIIIDRPQEQIENFRRSMENYLVIIRDIEKPRSKKRYLHPVFGSLNVHGWQCMAAFHQLIHRRQIKKILEYLV